MTYALSPDARILSKSLLARCAPPKTATPEVCPNSVADWAKEALGFEAEPKQIDVLNSDASRLILCAPRQWGKSTLIALKALHYALHHPNSEIVVLSDTEDHAGIIVEKLINYAATLHLSRRRAHGKSFSIELPNGAKIFAVAHTQRSGVGYTADVVIVDEAAVVDDEVLGYVSRNLSRTNGLMWLLSTPYGQTGIYHAIWHDDSLAWHRVRATIEDAKYLTPQFLEEQQTLFPETFRQDFHCEFLPLPGRLLSREQIARNVDPALNSRIIYAEGQRP